LSSWLHRFVMIITYKGGLGDAQNVFTMLLSLMAGHVRRTVSVSSALGKLERY
jgi:hypothetical protein